MEDRLIIYRGQSARSPLGLSWTLRRETAVGFARGHRGLLNPSPVIVETTVNKADVACYFTDRNEEEIVLFKPPAKKKCVMRPLTAEVLISTES